ncbi:uncharacterized protein PgNI_04878 [Pyricularia grisea]|uniref:Glycoprotease family protein n=1 Tax=Pyricularia grisea TaxID=148305 RepID=A0A6P8BAM3_PYRGI|nr:uncharacterized protein PgNI_04878 [Pyricularia grisea]TLD12737.1 hypothetical protein PgNI_04878 [Pyricularia grisea]
MNGSMSFHHNAHSQSSPISKDGNKNNQRDEWEDWTDDEPYSAIGVADLLLALENDENPAPLSRPKHKGAPSRKSSFLLPDSTYSVQKPTRLKSRARQKAQNTKAGIKVVTDMTKFRTKQQQQNQKLSAEAEMRKGQFADLAALQALEGDQNQTSVGSWHWLKKMQSKTGAPKSRMDQLRAESSPTQDLSPSDRPILIGLSCPPNQANINATTAKNSSALGGTAMNHPYNCPPQGQKSVWSPDTPSSAGSQFQNNRSRVASSMYSQPGNGVYHMSNAPPVPAVPLGYNDKSRGNLIDIDDDDNFTPVTLFEEDGSPCLSRKPTAKSIKPNTKSPVTTANTRSGWWDHLRTPFLEQSSTNPFARSEPKPATPTRQPEPETTRDEWWIGHDEKSGSRKQAAPATTMSPSSSVANDGSTQSATVASFQSPSSSAANDGSTQSVWSPHIATVMTIYSATTNNDSAQNVWSPQASTLISPSSSAANDGSTQSASTLTTASPLGQTSVAQATRATARTGQSRAEKGRILAEENNMPTEQPPPYSPTENKGPVRYMAVFPPGHALAVPRVPDSPGPISPGLANTMTSQGAINMTEVPLTPPANRTTAPRPTAPLPDRLPGTYTTGDHFLANVGNSPAARNERQRRRHEKEEVVARKAGGFWRGRGCIPANGCFGRTGREGRKRRRVYLGVCGGAIGVIVLVVVLVVVLLRKSTGAPAEQSIWLNLTSFPPIPTGVMTVVAPDNSQDITTCVQPATLWSCALPKEQQEANKPYAADQPGFVIQIQFDNSSQQYWNIPDGQVPVIKPLGDNKTAREVSSASGKRLSSRATTVGVQSLLRRDEPNPNFTPDPPLPKFEEMWFLGNWTDGIRSPRKAGEATPFYISILPSANTTAGPNMLGRRQSTNQTNLTPDLASLVPFPDVNADGTAKPAQLFSHPHQQQLRLFDRGLDTEHFGFYTYFNKTIFLRSKEVLDNTTSQLGDVPVDLNGGASRSEARYIAVWAYTRLHVQIWTRRSGTAKLLSHDALNVQGLSEKETLELRRPGTFPYPITIGEDTHGGDPNKKGTYTFELDDRGRPQRDNDKIFLQLNHMDTTTALINPRGKNFNPSFGGIDGGTGGCKCAWTNFVGTDGNIF